MHLHSKTTAVVTTCANYQPDSPWGLSYANGDPRFAEQLIRFSDGKQLLQYFRFFPLEKKDNQK
jgi:hypothetical protein